MNTQGRQNKGTEEPVMLQSQTLSCGGSAYRPREHHKASGVVHAICLGHSDPVTTGTQQQWERGPGLSSSLRYSLTPPPLLSTAAPHKPTVPDIAEAP